MLTTLFLTLLFLWFGWFCGGCAGLFACAVWAGWCDDNFATLQGWSDDFARRWISGWCVAGSCIGLIVVSLILCFHG